jgi:FkbM family methyltransferase
MKTRTINHKESMPDFFENEIKPILYSQFNSAPIVNYPVYIYGAGELGRLACDYCDYCGIEIVGFLDKGKAGESFHSNVMLNKIYPVYHPEDISLIGKHSVNVLVAIATLPYSSILNDLHLIGWKSISPFYAITSIGQEAHPLNNGWVVGPVGESEFKEISHICDMLEDEESLLAYKAFIAWHSNYLEAENLDPTVNPTTRYIVPPVLSAICTNPGQFVDVGAHQGETVRRFLDAQVVFRDYVLIEPDLISHKILKQNIAPAIPEQINVEYLDHVIGSTSDETVSFFTGLGYCSQICLNGNQERQTLRLDDLKLSPSFLKVHTEGSELNVLLGAAETITKHRPVIAASIYHNRDGLCKTISYLISQLDNYSFYFRLHSYQGTGAFIYAIPGLSNVN